MDWRALVESPPPNIGKLEAKKNEKKIEKKDFFQIQKKNSGLRLTEELWSNRVVLILRNKEDFFCSKIFFL